MGGNNIGDTEDLWRTRHRLSSDELLSRLRKHHSEEVFEPEVEPKPENKTKPQYFAVQHEPLKPIPNSAIAAAHGLLPRQDGFVRADMIQRAVLTFYPGMTMADMKSPRRQPKVVLPRHIAMYLCRELTGRSYPAIGRWFGGRDHTTILFGVNKIAKLVERDPEIASQVECVRAMFGEAA